MKVLGTGDGIHLVLWFYRWQHSVEGCSSERGWLSGDGSVLKKSWGAGHQEQVPWLCGAVSGRAACPSVPFVRVTCPLCGGGRQGTLHRDSVIQLCNGELVVRSRTDLLQICWEDGALEKALTGLQGKPPPLSFCTCCAWSGGSADPVSGVWHEGCWGRTAASASGAGDVAEATKSLNEEWNVMAPRSTRAWTDWVISFAEGKQGDTVLGKGSSVDESRLKYWK